MNRILRKLTIGAAIIATIGIMVAGISYFYGPNNITPDVVISVPMYQLSSYDTALTEWCPYQVHENPIVVIGDTHGNYNNFLKVGAHAGFLENEHTCEWAPSTSFHDIVMVGDYLDRGPDGVALMDCIQHLRETTPDSITFTTLYGNHEIMALLDGAYDTRYPEREAYQASLMPQILSGLQTGNLKAAHSIGHRLFTHAGLTRPFLDSIGFQNITSETTDLSSLVNYLNGESTRLFSGPLKAVRKHPFYRAGASRGGPKDAIPGFLWADWNRDTIDTSLYQIVGHSRSDKIRSSGNSLCIDTGITDAEQPQYLYIDVFDVLHYKVVL
jgi:hypothetical protein